MAKKSNKSQKKFPRNDSLSYTKAEWNGPTRRDRKKKIKKEKQY